MKFIEKENSCPCCYCQYYSSVTIENDYPIFKKGICQKHNILRNENDILCENFILMLGIHTSRWRPNKNGLED